MALVDGQLAPAEVPGLVQDLARDASLVAELQGYLAMSRARIGDAYAPKAEEPVPAWLIAAVRSAPAATAPRRRPAAVARVLAWLTRSYRIPAWSLAAMPASLAVAALALAVWLAAPRPGNVVQADLGAALERAESGKDAALASVRPVLTFRTKTAQWCRQIELRYPGRQVSHALACRGQDGRWSVLASTPAAAAASGFTPAGAERRKVIDDLVTEMIQGEPLSQAEEAAAIGRAWRR